MPADVEQSGHRDVIRAYHGITEHGDWILLADVRPSRLAGDTCSATDLPRFDETWLVVLGRQDRDIITLQGQDV